MDEFQDIRLLASNHIPYQMPSWTTHISHIDPIRRTENALVVFNWLHWHILTSCTYSCARLYTRSSILQHIAWDRGPNWRIDGAWVPGSIMTLSRFYQRWFSTQHRTHQRSWITTMKQQPWWQSSYIIEYSELLGKSFVLWPPQVPEILPQPYSPRHWQPRIRGHRNVCSVVTQRCLFQRRQLTKVRMMSWGMSGYKKMYLRISPKKPVEERGLIKTRASRSLNSINSGAWEEISAGLNYQEEWCTTERRGVVNLYQQLLKFFFISHQLQHSIPVTCLIKKRRLTEL